MYISNDKLKEMTDSGFARVIPFFEDYMITTNGKVISLKYKRGSRARIIRDRKHTTGYRQINIQNKHISKAFYIHRLVAEVFIHNPDNLPCVNHKNEIKSDNRVDNLEWCTHSYNVNYGNRNKKTASHLSKPVIQVSLDGKVINRFESLKEASSAGYGETCVGTCARGVYSNHRGYIWIYVNDYPTSDELIAEIDKRVNRIKNGKAQFNSKKVIQMDLADNIIKIWESAAIAERKGGFRASKISACCLGYNKTHKGYKWKYYYEYVKKEES